LLSPRRPPQSPFRPLHLNLLVLECAGGKSNTVVARELR